MPPADGDSWETSVRSVTLCTRFHATLQVSLSFGPAEPLHTPPRRRWTSADVPLQVHCSRCSRGGPGGDHRRPWLSTPPSPRRRRRRVVGRGRWAETGVSDGAMEKGGRAAWEAGGEHGWEAMDRPIKKANRPAMLHRLSTGRSMPENRRYVPSN